jgi:hypothetical protein
MLPGFDLECEEVLFISLVYISLIEEYLIVIKRYFSVFSVFAFLPFLIGDVDRVLNQLPEPDPDRFNVVKEVIDLGCP